MIVFDNRKFRETLKSIVEKKELNGDRIDSKNQLYMRIGEALHVSPDTVKYWQRDKSSGPDPRNPELLKKLEHYLVEATIGRQLYIFYKSHPSVVMRQLPSRGAFYVVF